MSATIAFNPKQTALLLMDFQNFVLNNFLPPNLAEKVVARAAMLLAAARARNVMVIHVTVGFRPRLSRNQWGATSCFPSSRKAGLLLQAAKTSQLIQNLHHETMSPLS